MAWSREIREPARRLLAVVCSVNSQTEATENPTAQDFDFFERQIRPVLVEHCYECHSGTGEKKLKGKLNLAFRQGLLRGGESGPAIVPGKPENSLLIKALRYESLEMPPKGKLSNKVIEDFVKWIKRGAADPRIKKPNRQPNQDNKTRKISTSLWSLQPLMKTQPPHVEGIKHPIDRFVRARLLGQKVPAAPAAKTRILMRRLSFNLIGLPPTPNDLTALKRANAKDRNAAFEVVVDRLFAKPEFGERWARHWLDLTSYADTIGVGRAIPALEAWRYRDYVIDAFNSDKPFDRFAREQIAGDITIPPIPTAPGGEPPTAESIIATGFLAIGPWELVGGDKVQLRMDGCRR